MAVRGRMGYLPAFVLEELNEIKQEKKLIKNNIAFYEMVRFARVGRELDRLRKLDFSKPMLNMPKKLVKKYRKGAK